MNRAAILALVAAGCAGPFLESKPSSPRAGVALIFCGSDDHTPEDILNALEPPTRLPPEVSGGELEPPEKLRVCLKLENKAQKVARLDRGNLELKLPRSKLGWDPDKDDQEIIVHPGESREFHVCFHYSSLPHGEEVAVLFERALTVGGKGVSLSPLILRKR